MNYFKAPDLIGHALERYSTVDLLSELRLGICDQCNADECDDCPTFAILAQVENQIGEAGVAFMKQLVKEWQENSIDR